MKQNWIKNKLGYQSNLTIYQDKTMFNYSIDTILLGNFVTINNQTKKVLEIGTNNAALAIFLSERYEKMQIDALEIQSEALEIAQENLKINKKQQQIKLIHDDFNHYYVKLMKNNFKYDAIVCNPPFYRLESSKIPNESEKVLIATHEIKLNLEQVIKGSSKILKQRGYLSLVLPTERFIDAVVWFRQYGFEIKRVQFIYPRIKDKSNLVLLEGRYKVGWSSHFLPNIYLHSNDIKKHEYLPEVKILYKPLIYNPKKVK